MKRMHPYKMVGRSIYNFKKNTKYKMIYISGQNKNTGREGILVECFESAFSTTFWALIHSCIHPLKPLDSWAWKYIMGAKEMIFYGLWYPAFKRLQDVYSVSIRVLYIMLRPTSFVSKNTTISFLALMWHVLYSGNIPKRVRNWIFDWLCFTQKTCDWDLA